MYILKTKNEEIIFYELEELCLYIDTFEVKDYKIKILKDKKEEQYVEL